MKLFYSISFVSYSTYPHLKPHNCTSNMFFTPLCSIITAIATDYWGKFLFKIYIST